jgi:hypothetical protein
MASEEQNLVADLVSESIKINGIDVYYLPRESVKPDDIYLEDTLREYQRALFVDMYLKSVDGFNGEGQFLSKFNLEIRDSVTFSVSQRTFQDEIAVPTGLNRPREADLIYFPQAKRMFEIKYVEKFPVMVPLGSLPFYDIKCEMYTFSNEVFNTGIREIDAIQANYSIALNNYAITTENDLELKDEDGYSLMQESYQLETNDPVADNTDIETEADAFVDFSERDPFSEATY